MDIPQHAHVLVIDGGKSRLFRNSGTDSDPKLVAVESPADNDEHSAAASGVSQDDYHQQAEDRIAITAADMLKREVLAGHIKALIVVAAPKTLGVLRPHYHGAVQKCLVGEIAKDFAGRPVDEITAAILSH